MFSELKGLEGIDILNECIPYVDNIISDKEMFEKIKDSEMNWLEAATPMYKAHPEEFDRLFELLGEKPETSVELVTKTAAIMSEIFSDNEVRSFFMLSCKKAKAMMSAMVNTKAEQSKAS